MTDAVITALIVAIPSTLTALAGVIVSIRNGNALSQVHSMVNGQQKHILKLARAKSRREGKAAEKAHPGTKTRKSTPAKS